jgi:hypothetical protein
MSHVDINFYPVLIADKAHFNKVVKEIYLNLLLNNPKPDDMSKSIYFVCLAIEILERMGNTYPTQEEIDGVESMVKRFFHRKSMKVYFRETHAPLASHVTSL